MFSLLLPLDTTAQRHLEMRYSPQVGIWSRLVRGSWRIVLTLIKQNR
jgi:hypothetical protein